MADDHLPKPVTRELGIVLPDDAQTPAYGIATPPYVVRKVNEGVAAVEARIANVVHDEAAASVGKMTSAALLKNRIFTWIVVGGFSATSLGGVAYAFETLRSNAKDAGTEGAEKVLSKVAETQKATEQRVTLLEQQRANDRQEQHVRDQRMESNQQQDHELALGNARKLDALLDRLDVRNPAPTPKDGGR